MKRTLTLILAVCMLCAAFTACTPATDDDAGDLTRAEKLAYIKTSGDYPEALIETAEKCPQTVDFVYNYPLYKDKIFAIDLSGEAKTREVPLLLQWDERWGYAAYGDGFIGTCGCGPTCLSMAALYLTGDARFSPLFVARMAEEKGYCVPGNGSSWTLISEGCAELGLSAQELPLWEQSMKNALDAGEVIILAVGEGDFTSSGHYLVVSGYSDSGFEIRDPNSRDNSAMTWTYSRLEPQITNLWSLSLAN